MTRSGSQRDKEGHALMALVDEAEKKAREKIATIFYNLKCDIAAHYKIFTARDLTDQIGWEERTKYDEELTDD